MKKFLFFALLLNFSNVFAQKDSVSIKDSINIGIIKNFNKNLAKLEQQRVRDSLKNIELEAQIISLKTFDILKKEEINKKLEELDKKEAIRIAKKKILIDSLRLTSKSYPVHGFFKDTLFLVYSKLGSFSAQDRAFAIESRIKKLADNFEFKANSIKIVDSESIIVLVFGETILMSISENDAIWNNSTKEILAKNYSNVITDSILKYKNETSHITLAKEIALAFLILVTLSILICYDNKLFNFIEYKIRKQQGIKINEFKVKSYTLFNSKQLVRAFIRAIRLAKWVSIFILVYLSLPLIFGIFPWTKHFADTLFGYILNPAKRMALGFLNYLPNLFTIIVIYFVFKYVLKGIHYLKKEIENEKLKLSGFYPDWANPTYQILKVVLYAFMFVLIFPYLPGSESPIFQGVSVFLGFLFTFGSAGSLSNIVAGIVLTYMRLFKIGDRIKIGDVEGDIIEKTLLVTRVRTIKNEIISIPNSTVISSHTTNFSNEAEMGNGLIMHTTVTIGYDAPWKEVHQALINAANRTDFLIKDPKPFVLQTSLDDFYVSYQINAYTKDANKQAEIYSILNQNIQDCCNEVGIEILSPHYRAGRDGNMTTIPTNYLDKDYQAPSFNLKIKK